MLKEYKKPSYYDNSESDIVSEGTILGRLYIGNVPVAASYFYDVWFIECYKNIFFNM